MPKDQGRSVILMREELYDKVWTVPMVKLANDFGVSDQGLAKICKRHAIPRPPRGYWAKKQHGKKIRQPPLPSIADTRLETITIRPQETQPWSEPDEVPVIAVQEALSKPHPLVARTEKSLRNARPDDRGLVTPHAKRALSVSIAPENIDRAMRIMDAVIRAVEERSWSVRVVTNDEGRRETVADVNGEPIEFSLTEKVSREERELTEKEQREKERRSWLYTQPLYRYLTTGLLRLEILSWGESGARRTWSDGKRLRLETHLGSFINQLVVISDAIKERHRQAEIARQERLAWEVERSEKMRMINEEEQKLEQLSAQVDTWHKSQRTRAYVEAVREEARRRHGGISEDSELGRWITWARDQADRFDPLVDSPPSILDEKQKWAW